MSHEQNKNRYLVTGSVLNDKTSEIAEAMKVNISDILRWEQHVGGGTSFEKATACHEYF